MLGVAMVSRIDKIIGLFCRILSLSYGSFTKETYNFVDFTNHSHPIRKNKRMARTSHVTCEHAGELRVMSLKSMCRAFVYPIAATLYVRTNVWPERVMSHVNMQENCESWPLSRDIGSYEWVLNHESCGLRVYVARLLETKRLSRVDLGSSVIVKQSFVWKLSNM